MHGADPGHAEGSIERQRDSVAALLCYYTFPEFMLFPIKPRSGFRSNHKDSKNTKKDFIWKD
ncbi:hypothetical protein BIY37_10800 [Candidatus Brocadia sapporoensis]|uniref:Uncharacterized protein n=1 Tax=Candidatus Brocadia sapporoensis TaxID=392547 RepID=A0A1V6LXW8_9BACT|nr:hypothetical protein BIY37_10800 [Candidatus Brocadia sapporoensis]TVL94755.1 MAG: hypothetical protein CV082_13655 [Candidatus Brocadia sp. BL1]